MGSEFLMLVDLILWRFIELVMTADCFFSVG